MAIGREVLGLENRQKVINCRIVMGASSAISSFSGRGVSNVTKNASGDLIITLEKAWNRLLSYEVGKSESGAAAPLDGVFGLDDQHVNDTGVLHLYTGLAAAPTTKADLATGTILNVTLYVSDSDV